MGKPKRLRRGMLVEIQFLDHVEGGDQPCEFVVDGRVTAVDRRSVTIEAWRYADPRERDKSNVTRFTILRSAIVGWWKLERA